MADQELSVRITGDTSSLDAATKRAATDLSNLKSGVDKLNASSADIAVNTNAETADKELSRVKGNVDRLDAESVEIPVALEMDRLNRDYANLQKVLARIEARKANPDVGLDISQLLREQGRVEAAMAKIDGRRAELMIDVNTQGATSALDDLAQAGQFLPGTLGAAAGNLGAIKSAGFGAAAGLTAAGYAAVKLNQAAADAETLKIQLDAVFGSGTNAYDTLQKFAAATPFGMEETAVAARTLGLAGIDLERIPSVLEDLGAAAAVAGQDLGSVSIVFAQMLGKGQIYAEEMQQLNERGVPAWSVLAEAIGKTEEETRALAEAGKLGRPEIEAFIAQFGEEFPTALADSAASFNGQVSTLQDNVDLLAQSIGDNLLPAFTALTGDLNTLVSAGTGAVKWAEDLASIGDTDGGFSLFDTFTEGALRTIPGVNSIYGIHDALSLFKDDAEESSDVADGFLGGLTGMDEWAANAAASVEGLAFNTEFLEANLEAANSELDDMISNFSVLKDGAANLPEALVRAGEAAETAAAGLKKANGNLTPQVRVDILAAAEAYGDVAAAQVEQGKSAETAARRYRNSIKELAGGNKDVEKFLAQSTEPIKPRLVELEATVTGRDEAEEMLDDLAKGRPAAIKALATNIQETVNRLNPLADPRTAPINAVANTEAAQAELLALTATRTMQVLVQMNPFRSSSGGGGGGSQQSAPAPESASLLAAPLAATQTVLSPSTGQLILTAPAAAPARETVVLAPRQTPVKVYLDGAEIATHIDMNARRASVPSGVRRP